MQSDLDAAYLAALHESRTFNCPDCVDAMAEAYGVTSAVNQLRVCFSNDQFNLVSQCLELKDISSAINALLST